jgi:hypothetical protein
MGGWLRLIKRDTDLLLLLGKATLIA